MVLLGININNSKFLEWINSNISRPHKVKTEELTEDKNQNLTHKNLYTRENSVGKYKE